MSCRRWRDRISSNVDYLQALHDEYAWIPGKRHIRPSVSVITAKKAWWDEIEQRYATVEDAVLLTVFGYAAAVGGAVAAAPSLGPACAVAAAPSIRLCVQRTLSGSLPDSRKVFRPNQFPYELPAGTQHGVMWYARSRRAEEGEGASAPALAYAPTVPSDAEVAADIEAHFARGARGDDVDFVWYENPKRSIPSLELHHLHVFWRVRAFG